jgi:hypothetical protein
MSETASLKALARLVLDRDRRRDTGRDRVSRAVSARHPGETPRRDTPAVEYAATPIPAADTPGETSKAVEIAETVTETGAETPAERGPQKTQPDQSITSVSLSRALEAETPETPAATWSEAEEERAAIVENDGGIPRAWAEGFSRLDPDRPPGDVPPRRWQTFIDDVGRFLDSPFRAVAAAEGWGPFDLFGCDRDRPFARIDQGGLLWLLNGDKLIELTTTAATIETKTGQRQRLRRKPGLPDRVMAWELAP